MVVYSFYIFDRHTECIYRKQWLSGPASSSAAATTTKALRPQSGSSIVSAGEPDNGPARPRPARLSAEDDAKLIFGTVFSLRNMVRKLGGPDDHAGLLPEAHTTENFDSFVSYRTGQYKLHYYETPTNLKFVMLTDIKTNNLRMVLHQIYVSLYVEFVVKNPLSPVEHPGGEGVANELFEMGLESFIVGPPA
ncbi:MAG: TRAPP subunit bet5 [Geoglossum umbratile]|nr:MAG: TRAPP subunit bet5 [Geoglossum umbratile]